MRGRHLIPAVAALAAGVSALPPPAHAACDAMRHAQPRTPRTAEQSPLAVGDSVMLGAFKQLVAAGFEVDVRGCRQMTEGLQVLAARARAGKLPRVVVVGLGTNWIVTTTEIRRALRILGPGRVLGLVTPRELGGERTSDQRDIRAAGRRWRRRVKVLDWVRYSAGRASWFAGDGLHLAAAGARGYTRLLSRAFEWSVSARTVTWMPVPSPPATESLNPQVIVPDAAITVQE